MEFLERLYQIIWALNVENGGAQSSEGCISWPPEIIEEPIQ